MIQFIGFYPSLLLSGNIPDIHIATDHEAINFRLTIYGNVLLEGRYHAFDGFAYVSDIAPLIEHHMADNSEIDVVDVLLEAYDDDESASLELNVLYCNKYTDMYDPSDWLRENFLTLTPSRRIAPDGYINVAWYTTEKQSIMFRVYVTYLDENGNRKTYTYVNSGNGQIAHINGILTQLIYISDLRLKVIEGTKVQSPTIQYVTVVCGNRSASFFVDPALEVYEPIFYLNCFGVVEHLTLPRTTTVKVKTDRSLTSLGKRSQFYDISTSKEYEVESGPLTSDECLQVEQMLTSPSVRIPFGYACDKYDYDFDAMRPILITDYTCEFSDSDEKLNKVKFTWRFAENTPTIEKPTTPGIFNDKFNPVFS